MSRDEEDHSEFGRCDLRDKCAEIEGRCSKERERDHRGDVHPDKEGECGYQRHPAQIPTAAFADCPPHAGKPRDCAAAELVGDRIERDRHEWRDERKAHGQRIDEVRQVEPEQQRCQKPSANRIE